MAGEGKWKEEVWGAVESYAGDKALGPDSFTLAFFQQFWSTAKGEVLENATVF